MQLRDYQSECSDAIVKDLETYDRVSAVLPTGSGKSLIEIDIIDRLMVDTPFDHCILFLCHIKDLAVQLYESYQAHGKSPKAAFMFVGTRKPFFSSKILFSTMQSACSDKRRLNKPLGKRVTHIVIDEAHFFGVKSYEKICDEFYPDAKVIGFSATPFRQNQFSFSMFDRVSFAI
ncbi:MAG: DEAD/DEAH box helicase family protein, partial [Desulfobulbaceae bacterium]|nr:DEAD/DEAH box helicase family protein [Desulfobulbaceae bacterium]